MGITALKQPALLAKLLHSRYLVDTINKVYLHSVLTKDMFLTDSECRLIQLNRKSEVYYPVYSLNGGTKTSILNQESLTRIKLLLVTDQKCNLVVCSSVRTASRPATI